VLKYLNTKRNEEKLMIKICRLVIAVLCLLTLAAIHASLKREAAAEENHLLYVASPGIRNYVEFAGNVLVG
jgi:hypothetical protein